MKEMLLGLRTAFASPRYRVLGIVTFGATLALYLMTLPSSFTGGRIGPSALRFLDAELVVFSVIMAALVAFLLPVMAYVIRQGQRASKTSATGGVIVGLMTPILCCSPALPIALGFVATFFPSLVNALGWQLQGFIATHQTELFTAASVLLLFALYQNARNAARGPACAVPARLDPGQSEKAT